MLRFGTYELDEARRLLHRAGTRVALQPRVFDLLLYLIRNRERAVGRAEILQHVWADVVVEPSVLSAALRKLRKALEDETGDGSWVETVHGFGLRFQGEVEASRDGMADAAPAISGRAAGDSSASPSAITVLAPRRIAEGSRDLTLLTCQDLLLQLHGYRVWSTLDAEFVTDRAGRLLRSARGSKVHYVLSAHASRAGEEFEALARLTDVLTLRVVWSHRAVVVETDPILAARSLSAQIAASVSTSFMLGRSRDLTTGARQQGGDASVRPRARAAAGAGGELHALPARGSGRAAESSPLPRPLKKPSAQKSYRYPIL